MKRFSFLAIALLLSVVTFAAPKISLINNAGSWRNNSTWDLNRQPQNGDTVIIPFGKRVIVDNNVNLNNSTIYVKVLGTLELDGGKLRMGINSTVFVYIGGKIFGKHDNDKIRIGNEDKFSGSDPAIDAVAMPYYANSNTGDGFSAMTLPVKFISFSIARTSKNVLVQWSTSEEQNADKYEVERSTDGANWSVIAYVMAAGNTSSVTNYSYTDKNTTGKVYYRIKQIDIDGRFAYTQIRLLNAEARSASVNISGVNGKVMLQFEQEEKSAVTMRLVTLSGQVIISKQLNNPVGQITIDANGLSGLYVVSLSNTQGFTVAKKIIL